MENYRTIIIQASSRSIGNTNQIIEVFRENYEADVVDISQLNIGFYDYEHRNGKDDFLPTMKRIVEYDLIIFATPVYWYSMSGSLKTFLDRITECLKTEKDTGRKLRGKNMAVISCGSEETEVEGFFVPFKLTAEYLGMNYLGEVHTWVEGLVPDEKVLRRINEFTEKLKSVQTQSRLS